MYRCIHVSSGAMQPTLYNSVRDISVSYISSGYSTSRKIRNEHTQVFEMWTSRYMQATISTFLGLGTGTGPVGNSRRRENPYYVMGAESPVENNYQ